MGNNTGNRKSLTVIRVLVAGVLSIFLSVSAASAQGLDRRDVRKGNRDFRKEDYKSAEIDYRKALVKDSTSFAANYNLGNTLYRTGDIQQAAKYYEALGNAAPTSPYAADYYYNTGNAAALQKDWKSAVDSYRQSLLRNPADLEAKENYIYAKKMLENQQNQNQDQNQDNQDNKNNQDQNQDKDQNKDNSQDQDQNQDQNQNQDGRQDRQNQSGQQPKITPQAAQQMLQAIQAKEKETQEKVKKEKAQALKSRQKEKNW